MSRNTALILSTWVPSILITGAIITIVVLDPMGNKNDPNNPNVVNKTNTRAVVRQGSSVSTILPSEINKDNIGSVFEVEISGDKVVGADYILSVDKNSAKWYIWIS